MIWMVYNSRNLFSRGSEGWKSNIKVSARLVPIQGFEGTSVSDSSSSFWGIVMTLVFLGLCIALISATSYDIYSPYV